ncbi:U2 snRNP component prp10 [Marasmius crinis-equi]|uniref:U2 snRNP component prp10 n=1 Tax=Marasmius crinis-equi TaxID=585013 RepID=A0ABR3FJP8_9AGAR
MNAPGFMQEDEHNRYLSDEELDAILPATGYAIVTPSPGNASTVRPCRLTAPPVTEVGFHIHIQESSDVAVVAAAAGLAPELLAAIPRVGNLAFFKTGDAQYCTETLKEEVETELFVGETKERKEHASSAEDQKRHRSCPKDRVAAGHPQRS